MGFNSTELIIVEERKIKCSSLNCLSQGTGQTELEVAIPRDERAHRLRSDMRVLIHSQTSTTQVPPSKLWLHSTCTFTIFL